MAQGERSIEAVVGPLHADVRGDDAVVERIRRVLVERCGVEAIGG